jgi:Trypsin
MRRKSYSLVLALFALVALQGCRAPQSNVNTEAPNANSENDESGPVAVVGGGAAEPNYRYPWVVRLHTGCYGVVIHPRWVLTAAHCITPVIEANIVEYSRTDPYTGAVQSASRGPALNGVIKHPDFDPLTPPPNDLALIKLAEPFPITPYLQTAAIPSTPTVAGPVGTVAASSHTTMLPPDKYAIFREEITPQTFGNSFMLTTTIANGSLCPGDSGSAFVTYESGRATIRGIVSQSDSDCVNPAGNHVSFTDVFAHRDWIFQTTGMTDNFLAGNTRVRWSGRWSVHGTMGLGCPNDYGTMWGPIDVPGVELGANCEKEQTQTIVCSLNGNGSGPVPLGITSFRMKTVCAPHSSTDDALPISSSTWASYFGQMPANPDPLGFCQREFKCKIGMLTPGSQDQAR